MLDDLTLRWALLIAVILLGLSAYSDFLDKLYHLAFCRGKSHAVAAGEAAHHWSIPEPSVTHRRESLLRRVMRFLGKGRQRKCGEPGTVTAAGKEGSGRSIPTRRSNFWKWLWFRITGQSRREEVSPAGRAETFHKDMPNVDASLWKNTEAFQLGDAACLWVGVEPHDPITHVEARAKFDELRAAVMRLKIDSHFLSVMPDRRASGEKNPWPEYDFYVTADALREYAESCGAVPPFLGSRKGDERGGG